MTAGEAERAMHDRTEVSAGEGDDWDTGIIMRIFDDKALVSWASGIRAWISVADLEKGSR